MPPSPPPNPTKLHIMNNHIENNTLNISILCIHGLLYYTLYMAYYIIPKYWLLGGQVYVVRGLSALVGFVQELTILGVPTTNHRGCTAIEV